MGKVLIKLTPAVDAQTIANTSQNSDGGSEATETAARAPARANATSVVPIISFRIVKGGNSDSAAVPPTNSHRHENAKRMIHNGI